MDRGFPLLYENVHLAAGLAVLLDLLHLLDPAVALLVLVMAGNQLPLRPIIGWLRPVPGQHQSLTGLLLDCYGTFLMLPLLWMTVPSIPGLSVPSAHSRQFMRYQFENCLLLN